MRSCSATDRQIGSDWVWKSSRSTEVFWKKCISYQFRADVQTYGHRPRYTAHSDAAETAVCAVRLSTLSHTSCGTLGERFVSKDELRTSQVCVLQSHRRQHGALHPGRNRRHSLGVGCSVWQRRTGFISSVSRAVCVQIIALLFRGRKNIWGAFSPSLPLPPPPPKLRPYWEQYQSESAKSITTSGISHLVLYVMPIGDLQTKIHFASRETAPPYAVVVASYLPTYHTRHK
jgi:hypothetical protein